MIKRLLMSLLVVLGVFGVKAQDMNQMMMQPLPLNPAVKHGTLPNGLNYFILHNEEPKNRANFYIAQKVGSSLEESNQLGLAHFLEHMAFNGTEHYPGKTMLEYLQNKGIRFGADINASTGFDETNYHINNVNTQDQALMDSVLLVLYDWSCAILLEEDEINAERGVIEEEYNARNGADFRLYEAILPKIYTEYQYQQLPIGKMEIIRNFPPQAIRDYYKKWYRPDLQGIVIVGDFDADAMEKKVVDLFSKIPMPENAAERIYPTISDNEKPIYVTFDDPEWSQPMISIDFKFDPLPVEARNTIIGFAENSLMRSMVVSMINHRLNEYALKAECPYTEAGVSIGTFAVSPQKGSFSVTVIPKGNIIEATQAAMAIVTQACKTGFMGTEVQRVRDDILASYERHYNERDKMKNSALANELIAYFTQNEPDPGIEIEYELAKQLLMSLPEAVYNEYASQLIHADNQVIMVVQPTTPDLNVPAENDMLTALANIINADYEPYVDEVITEPLLAKQPKAGKIKSQKSNIELGTKEYTLSNGVKVVVKPTDYANDEILVYGFKKGGYKAYSTNEASDVLSLDGVLDIVKIGPFTPTRLSKYYSGKHLQLDYGLNQDFNVFNGLSTKKDLNSLFELIYASFTSVSPDLESFNASIERQKVELSNQENNPMFTFQTVLMETIYPNNAFMRPLTVKALGEINYNNVVKLYKESVQNAADYTFFVVGNVDEKTLEPLLCQYLASLPSKGKATVAATVTNMGAASGQITKEFDIPSKSPAVYVYDYIHQGGLQYSSKNTIMIGFLGSILDNIFTATLREEMGGTYSPQSWAQFSPFDNEWSLQWFVITNAEVQKAIRDRAFEEFNKLLQNGASADNFNKVKEAEIKQYENRVRTNAYWIRSLNYYNNGFNNITDYKSALESITLDEFNKFIKNLYNGQNNIEVVGDAK